jgi:hypothetical protein
MCFFWRFLESRNYKIQIVAHVEGKSVALLSGIMEASYSAFFYRARFQLFTQQFPMFVERLQKLPLQASNHLGVEESELSSKSSTL